jgi:hypothetical protein
LSRARLATHHETAAGTAFEMHGLAWMGKLPAGLVGVGTVEGRRCAGGFGGRCGSTTGVTIVGSNLAGEERVLVGLLEVMLADGSAGSRRLNLDAAGAPP